MHTDCISAQVRGWPCCSVSLGVPEMKALAFSWRSSLRQHTQLNSAVLETQAPKILLQLSAHLLCVCTAFQLFGVRGLCSCTPTNTPSPVPPPPPPCTHKHTLSPLRCWRTGNKEEKPGGGGVRGILSPGIPVTDVHLQDMCRHSTRVQNPPCSSTEIWYKTKYFTKNSEETWIIVCGGHTRGPVALTKLPYSIF